jgi:sorbitol-specific phosphotransferase system component IIBC
MDINLSDNGRRLVLQTLGEIKALGMEIDRVDLEEVVDGLKKGMSPTAIAIAIVMHGGVE